MATAFMTFGGRLFSSFGVGLPPASTSEDDEIEMQVHEKEDVELDVLNLRDREGPDEGHIVDLSADGDAEAPAGTGHDSPRSQGGVLVPHKAFGSYARLRHV